QPVAFTVKAADADGDKVSFGDIETDITNASFDKTTGKFVWTPSESDIGKTYSVTFSAYDYTYDYSSNKSSVTVKISVGDGSSNEYAVIAAADAEVHQWSSQTGSNYGTQNYVTISGRSGDNKTAYFNFDLTDIKSSCSDYTKAVLALTYIGGRYGNNGTETLNAGAVIDTWDESSITWSNKPSFTAAASGTLVTGSTGINNNFGTGVAINGTVAKIDITDLVKSAIENGDTALSLGVSSANNANEEMYFVSREGAAGGLTNAVSSMAPSIILSVPTTEVSISGTTAMTLGKNYKATETDSYLVKGNDVKVTLSCDEDTDGRITWDSATNQIKIAEGLAVGDYNVTLTASNGTNTDTAAFALSVIDKEIVVIKAAADTDVHSYSGDYQKSYSGNNYLSVNLNDSDNGTFGENLAGATGDGKIAYINFDISALKSYDLSKADVDLVLTYMGTRASTGSARINVAAAASYANGMNWTTKPAIDTSVVKSSDTITLKDSDSDVIKYNMGTSSY
ncbi:MAG: DNRLRE domain-containing protein, partial [Candidatus Ornithomonoglobus sp.]